MQIIVNEVLSKYFPKWSGVFFYDKREGPNYDPDTIYIGEFKSETIMFPCGEIKLGKGQCGLCASTRQT